MGKQTDLPPIFYPNPVKGGSGQTVRILQFLTIQSIKNQQYSSRAALVDGFNQPADAISRLYLVLTVRWTAGSAPSHSSSWLRQEAYCA